MDFIPAGLISRYRNKVNPKKDCMKALDKSVFNKIMSNNGVPIVKQLFILHRSGKIMDAADNEIVYLNFEKQLIHDGSKLFFLKPAFGNKGIGIHRIVKQGSNLMFGEKIMTADVIFNILIEKTSYEKYVLEYALQQQRLLNDMHPKSVNTIRIDTLVTENNNIFINAALLRVGNGHFTGICAKGGFYIPVNIEHGTLREIGKTEVQYGCIERKAHPITGFIFGQVKIPYWKELLKLVSRAAKVMLPIRSIGWDVAITEIGPVIIEANHDYDVFLSQEAAGGLMKTPLGVEIRNFI